MAWFQGLDGTTLVVAISVLMFIEETGVPLPFAPGDLVLAIAGIAVAGPGAGAGVRRPDGGATSSRWPRPSCSVGIG